MRDAHDTFEGSKHSDFSSGDSLARFWALGVPLQDLRQEAPENGAKGAVLNNFGDISEKFVLKDQIKSKHLGV